MAAESDLEALHAQAIDHHVRHGQLPPIEELAGGRPDVAVQLRELVHRYLDLTMALDAGVDEAAERDRAAARSMHGRPGLPSIDGFQMIERLGQGGMGEVYKLQDLNLGRTVAAKFIRPDAGARVGAQLADFLREARSLALFSDPRMVQIFEFRADADPPVIIMEFVQGFELGRIGRSLEFRQRATVVRDVADAIDRAHELGIQHRDLKPSNIMLDSQLRPKILDFGLSDDDPTRGHLKGTINYIAPEQLDRSQAIDRRTDIYALGVVLYELLCGAVPYTGGSDAEVIEAIRAGQPRLPVEIDPTAPVALQAIALKAMELRPVHRYQTAREMVVDLERYLEGRPVTARPTQYATTLGTRVRPHMDQISEWLRLKLIYPHEATALQSAYRQLEAREDDWIVASRALSYSQIALYLGAFFLFAGSLFYFWAHRIEGSVSGLARPFVVLGLPFIGLNVAGRWLYRREHQAVAVAFYLAGVSLLPLFLLIWFHETGIWVAAADAPGQLFGDGSVSNRQLQVTVLTAAAWSSWLALRTKTSALSTVSAVLVFLFGIAVVADFGLRGFLDEQQFHRLAIRLAPMIPIYAIAGLLLERSGRPWFARPCYVTGAVSLVAVLDLLALDGKLFQHLGISLQALQPADVSWPVLIDTLTAFTLNGFLFYGAGAFIERRGTPLMTRAAQLLFVIAPFSMLEPLAYLSERAEYQKVFDWAYLAVAVAIAILSHTRQRRSFYYAGVINSGVALYLIALRNRWFDDPSWATALVAVGLAALVTGFLIDAQRRRKP